MPNNNETHQWKQTKLYMVFLWQNLLMAQLQLGI